MQNTNYSNRFAISQSSIKDFRFKSPKRWKSIWVDKQLDLTKKDENFVFGSFVDTLLFTPKELDNRFYVSEALTVPTGAVEKIVKNVYKSASENTKFLQEHRDVLPTVPGSDSGGIGGDRPRLEDYRDEILNNCISEDWNATWKPDTRVNKIIEKGAEYFDLLQDSENRKVITSEMNLDAINLVSILKNSTHVGKYFKQSKDYENRYQVELFTEYINPETGYKIPLKCAIDIIHIDHKAKQIQLVDFKTSHDAFDFIKSIKQYSYGDQLSFYIYMLQQVLESKDWGDEYGLQDYKNYKIISPINIVIDKEDKVPYIYEYSWDDIIMAGEGNESFLFDLYQTNNHNAKVKKGWISLLREIAWHFENNKWDYPKEFYETGKIKVNLTNS